jgi:hypothetical protein
MNKATLLIALVVFSMACSPKEAGDFKADTSITFLDTALDLSVTLTETERVYIFFEIREAKRMAKRYAKDSSPLFVEGDGQSIKEYNKSLMAYSAANVYVRELEILEKRIDEEFGITGTIRKKIVLEAIEKKWQQSKAGQDFTEY